MLKINKNKNKNLKNYLKKHLYQTNEKLITPFGFEIN